MFDNNKYYKKIIGQKYDELYQLDNYYIKKNHEAFVRKTN